MDSLRAPTYATVVHKEECTLCFESQDSEHGLDVCLVCFNGACPAESPHHHSQLHHEKTGHRYVVNIKRTRRPIAAVQRDDEPPIKKLAIRADVPDADKYDYTTVCKQLGGRDGSAEMIVGNEKLEGIVTAILAAQSSAQKSEVKAWEEEIVECAHTRNAVQLESSPVGATCSQESCSLTSPLWLCLICGSLGCGRKQFGGAAGGGEGHGVEHYATTGHAIAVKMGTIEMGGTGDVYCYLCDDARIDPHLSSHLAHFGIDVGAMTKTEKSMTELQIEQNLKFDFAMTGADGKDLEPVFGPGLTGLKNLGNSCYLASTLQSLFSLPAFSFRYLSLFDSHPRECTSASPATCLECQMAKMADGLLSGRYSVVDAREEGSGYLALPDELGEASAERSTERARFQKGIAPTMFKALVGKDHPEFATMKQQDADEFLKHLLKLVRQSIKAAPAASMATTIEDPTRQFCFTNETRLQCSECRGVRYSVEEQESITVPVDAREIVSAAMVVDEASGKEKEVAKAEKVYESVALDKCFENLMSTIEVDYHCPACDKKVTAYKTNRFATFPQVLAVNASRFQYVNWVPTKVNVPLIVPWDSLLSLDQFLGKGKQEGERELPVDDTPGAPEGPQFNADAMAQLMGMGFPEIRCQRGLLATGNGGAEEAMNWLFAHMDDPDIDDPLPAAQSVANSNSNTSEPTPDQITQIVEMGFSAQQGRKALKQTDCDVGRAIEWLFSHPDDNGEEASASSSTDVATPVVYGSSTLPAQYRLKSFISHKGPSVHSGHYVAHVRSDQLGGKWVLFNDEKVVKADETVEEAVKFAYVYIFERV